MESTLGRIDWVFWVQIEKRDWFKKIWKSRGSNCLNFHFYGYHISIGMPWLKHVIDSTEPLSIEKTNLTNREGVKTHGRFRWVKK
jgi:hypothetical protein